jgi:hypothetical protein
MHTYWVYILASRPDYGAAGECLLSCHHGLGVFAFLGTINTVILGLVPRIQRAAYS